MKTIGILGGLGPQATMDFVARVHAVSQRLYRQERGNSGYPPLVVYYHRDPPILFEEDGTPQMPYVAHPDLLKGARWLGQTADFLVIAANGPHRVADQIEAAADIPLLRMPELVLDEVERRRWQRVGALGKGKPVVYIDLLQKRGLEAELIYSPLRDVLDDSIMRFMAGNTVAEDTAVALQAVEELRMRGVDGIVPGCTEIPLLLGEAMAADDLINPLQLLAETAVRRAMSN